MTGAGSGPTFTAARLPLPRSGGTVHTASTDVAFQYPSLYLEGKPTLTYLFAKKRVGWERSESRTEDTTDILSPVTCFDCRL